VVLFDNFLDVPAFLKDVDGSVNVLDCQRVLLLPGPDHFRQIVVVALDRRIGINAERGNVAWLRLCRNELFNLALP
jgi:hypothetical protein